jgi:hypothetical protein
MKTKPKDDSKHIEPAKPIASETTNKRPRRTRSAGFKKIDWKTGRGKSHGESKVPKLDRQNPSDTFQEKLKKGIRSAVTLPETELNKIILAWSRQMELNADHNINLVDAIQQSSIKNSDRVLDLIQEKLEALCQLTIDIQKRYQRAKMKKQNLG